MPKKYKFKVAFIGDYGVGKSSLFRRMVKLNGTTAAALQPGGRVKQKKTVRFQAENTDDQAHDHHAAHADEYEEDEEDDYEDDEDEDDEEDDSHETDLDTPDFVDIKRTIDGHIIDCSLWDTAGMEEHSSVEGSYFRGIVAFFLVFDLSNFRSFERIDYWRREIDKYAVDGVRILLVGNKADVGVKNRVIESYEGKKKASELTGVCGYYEVTSRTLKSVTEPFDALMREVVKSDLHGISITHVEEKKLEPLPVPHHNNAATSTNSSSSASSSSTDANKNNTIRLDARNNNTQKKKKKCC